MADEWNDDDDSEEEEDFMPAGYDEDDGDSDLEGEDFDEDPSAFPPFLEGNLFMDPARSGALCYEQEGVFCLVCQSSLPSKKFDFQSPPTDTPLMFAGWVQTPANFMEFFVEFSRQAPSDDPLEEKLLKAQDEKNAIAGQEKQSVTKSPGDDDEETKKASASGSLKAPPSYSLKEDDSELKKSAPESNLKAPPSYSVQGTKASTDKDSLVAMTATQVKDSGGSNHPTISVER